MRIKIDGTHRKRIVSFTLFDYDVVGLVLHDFELPRDLEHRIVVEGHEEEVRSELRGDEGDQLRVRDRDPPGDLGVGGDARVRRRTSSSVLGIVVGIDHRGGEYLSFVAAACWELGIL